MKCPHCGLYTVGAGASCPGCDFTVGDVDRALGRVPEQRGLFNDFAGVLDPEDAGMLQARLQQFARACGGPLVIALVPSAAPVSSAEYAFWLMSRWHVGGPRGEGMLLLLALQDRSIHCTVGYGWEGLVTDEEVGEILSGTAVPPLVRGDTREALLATVTALEGSVQERIAPADARLAA